MRRGAATTETFARVLAVILAALRAVEPAIDALEDSVRLGFSHYPYIARHSPSLAAPRDHPRFQGLLEFVRGRWERGGTSAEDLA